MDHIGKIVNEIIKRLEKQGKGPLLQQQAIISRFHPFGGVVVLDWANEPMRRVRILAQAKARKERKGR